MYKEMYLSLFNPSQREPIMEQKPFSKAWRQDLIANHSKARVVCYGYYPHPRQGVTPKPFNPMARQIARLT